MKKGVIVVLGLMLTGCAIPEKHQDGRYAPTIISPSFKKENKRIAILPFLNSGKEGTDQGISDTLSTKLMEIGFTVVDRSQLEAVFGELKLNMSGAISPSKLKEVGKILSVDSIVQGTMQYKHIPAQGYVNAWGGSQVSDSYSFEGITMRMIDVETGEVLLSSYCCKKGFIGESMSTEIVRSIEQLVTVKKVK